MHTGIISTSRWRQWDLGGPIICSGLQSLQEVVELGSELEHLALKSDHLHPANAASSHDIWHDAQRLHYDQLLTRLLDENVSGLPLCQLNENTKRSD